MGLAFLRFGILLCGDIVIPRWRVIGIGEGDEQDRGTIGRRICCVRRSIRSSTWGTRWCGWRRRSTGSFSMTALASVCANRSGSAWLADAAGRRPVHPEAHAQPLGRGAVRALDREPLLPILLRRVELLPRSCRSIASSMTRWRQRLGEEQLVALIQESLSVAHKTGAIETKDLERVVVDTTVQPKAVAHPTDARLMHRALEKLVALAKRNACAAAPELSAGGQARRHHGRPLYPRAPVQARPAPAQVPAHPTRPDHPRHPPQDRWRCGAGSPLRPAARSGAVRCASRIIVSAARRSMRCMPRRSSASARAKPARLTSSAARSRSPPR